MPVEAMPVKGHHRGVMRQEFEKHFVEILRAQRGKEAADALIDVCWNVYLLGLKDGIAKGLTYKMEEEENG